MTPVQFDALRSAVTIAKNEQIKSVAKLRGRLLDFGYLADDIKVALDTWAQRKKEQV